MPLPYQYRDYPLALFMGIVVIVGAVWESVGAGRQPVEIEFADACCAGVECPVVESLAKLSVVRDVRHVPGDRNVVSLTTDGSTSARRLWDSVASAQRQPLRLVVDRREYVSRPIE